uniref:NADH-ubiquinone oxidoreductase chain 2 n=1 Tax=Krisna rufimarginata TaxID=1962558 RepID=A0A6C0MCQ8_9HEMI|nr:NADH dehydrogenase subunit 2 [Krisna rufimarginata]QHV34359.1 NADH dehydrogenase subunit 2 [Krisna rufimarginata]
MFMNSSNILFIGLTTMGVVVSFSSMSWMMMWIGMEISLISFVPLISIKSILNSEFSMKYFIIQSVSSMIIMLSLMMMMMKMHYFDSMLTCSLIMKMGGAPFHNWIVSTIDGLSHESMFILLTIMKLSPLLMISYMNMNLILFTILSLLTGSINGINQSSMKKLLTFSSIYNLGLILYSLTMNNIWIQIMMMYSFMLISILMIMMKYKINFLNQIMFTENNNFKKLMLFFCLMSLGGMPPFLGFQVKMMLFELMMLNMNILLTLVMILTSMITLYYYMNLTISFLMFNSTIMKINLIIKMKINTYFMVLMMNLNLFFSFMMTKFMT